MTLDIKFWSPSVNTKDSDSVEIVDIIDPLYEHLDRSGFSNIGKSQKLTVLEDGEKIDIYAVILDDKTRSEFQDFFQKLVLEECNNVCKSSLDNSLPIEEILGKLRTLNSLYQATENKKYHYLDRDDKEETSEQKPSRA